MREEIKQSMKIKGSMWIRWAKESKDDDRLGGCGEWDSEETAEWRGHAEEGILDEANRWGIDWESPEGDEAQAEARRLTERAMAIIEAY